MTDTPELPKTIITKVDDPRYTLEVVRYAWASGGVVEEATVRFDGAVLTRHARIIHG